MAPRSGDHVDGDPVTGARAQQMEKIGWGDADTFQDMKSSAGQLGKNV